MDESRAGYVEALKVERAMLASRRESPDIARRISEVDALLDSYADKPVQRRVEKAVPKK